MMTISQSQVTVILSVIAKDGACTPRTQRALPGRGDGPLGSTWPRRPPSRVRPEAACERCQSPPVAVAEGSMPSDRARASPPARQPRKLQSGRSPLRRWLRPGATHRECEGRKERAVCADTLQPGHPRLEGALAREGRLPRVDASPSAGSSPSTAVTVSEKWGRRLRTTATAMRARTAGRASNPRSAAQTSHSARRPNGAVQPAGRSSCEKSGDTG
jgi:hypothetical protein